MLFVCFLETNILDPGFKFWGLAFIVDGSAQNPKREILESQA